MVVSLGGGRGSGRAVEVGGEFKPGDRVMGLFAQGGSDAVHEISAVPFAFACNTLDVLGVNAKAGCAWFHGVRVCITKFSVCTHISTEQVR